jgi:hypothetical protein
MGATGFICGFSDAAGRPGTGPSYLVLTRSPNRTCQVRVANAVTVWPLPQTAGRICWRVAVVPGLFLAGYAAVKAMVQPRPGRGWWPYPESCLGVS